MRKISVFLIVCIIVCAFSVTSFADTVYTNSVTKEGIVTYANNFESLKIGDFKNKTQGISIYNKSTNPPITYKVAGDSENKYLELENNTADIYPTARINFVKTNADPKINSLADAKNYKITFKMRYNPTTVNKIMKLTCGALWQFKYNGGGNNNTYTVSSGSGAPPVQGAAVKYPSNSTEFTDYEIEVKNADSATGSATLKIGGNVIFENEQKNGTNDFKSLLIEYNKSTGKIAIDDIKVTVTDTAVCHDTDYAAKTSIDFEDFGIGIIPNEKNTAVGGFENDNEFFKDDTRNSHAYIDYEYDSASPATVNKYLKITKNDTGKVLSVKRDISSVVENYSEYEVSFKIKNDLAASGSTAVIMLGDKAEGNNGALIRISKFGTISWRDYAYSSEDSNAWQSVQSLVPAGKWKNIKLKIYKDENKADLYVENNLVASKFTTDRKYGGDCIVFAPQISATGSISIDNIAINPIKEADYALTYTTDADNAAQYTTSGVYAQCKIKNGFDAPVIILAQYGADGHLMGVTKSGVAENGTISANIENVSANEGESISVMLWKSLDNPIPLKRLINLTPALSAAE